jgi:hypothetical protein
MEAKRLLKKVPSQAIIKNKTFDFLVLVPITVAEFMIWRSVGYKALLQHFSRQKRNLFHFHQVMDENNCLVPESAPQRRPSRSAAKPAAAQPITARTVSPRAVQPKVVASSKLHVPQAASTGAAAKVQSMAPKAKISSKTQVTHKGETYGKPASAFSQLSLQPKTSVPVAVSPQNVRNTSSDKSSDRQYQEMSVTHVSTVGTAAQVEPVFVAKQQKQVHAENAVDSAEHIAEQVRGGLLRSAVESVAGTVMLVGGFVTTMAYAGGESLTLTAVPAVFTVAGLLTLAVALQDALAAGQRHEMAPGVTTTT